MPIMVAIRELYHEVYPTMVPANDRIVIEWAYCEELISGDDRYILLKWHVWGLL